VNDPTVTPELQNAIDAIESRVEIRVAATTDESGDEVKDATVPQQPRVFMVWL
jgi:hypothetical protein